MGSVDTLVLVKRAGKDVLAVQEQVEREAQVAWALKEDASFETIPPMQVKKASINQVWAFARSVLP